MILWKRIKWDTECSNLRHIYVILTMSPHYYRWLIALSVHGPKEVAELSLRSTGMQLANKIEKTAAHYYTRVSPKHAHCHNPERTTRKQYLTAWVLRIRCLE